MKSGEMYALDMAGAQYGWHESIMPWELYSTSRVREIKAVLPFGGTSIFCKTRAKAMGKQCEWIQHIKEGFAKNVDEALIWWQRGNISTTDLLRTSENEFQSRKASLLGIVEEFLVLYRTMQERQGGFHVKGGFKHGALDRAFTSAALGVIPGRHSPPANTS